LANRAENATRACCGRRDFVRTELRIRFATEMRAGFPHE
jgi:hypothetical protein